MGGFQIDGVRKLDNKIKTLSPQSREGWALCRRRTPREEFYPRFSDPDRSLNRKRERFKGFEVGPRSNRGRTVMT